MPEDRELGASNPLINHWLQGVQSAIDEGTLYGHDCEIRSGRLHRKFQSQHSLLMHHCHSGDYIHDKNRNIESLDLEGARLRYFLHCPGYENTTLTLPKIPSARGQKLAEAVNSINLEVIDLEKEKIIGTQDKDMELNNSSNNEDSNYQVSIAELSVNNLRLNNNYDDNRDIILEHDSSPKNGPSMLRSGSTGVARIAHKKSLTIAQNATTGFTYESNNVNQVRGDTPFNHDKAKFFLPSVMTCDTRRYSSDGIPRITVCQDGDHRISKPAKEDFNPNFLMPTESSVEEARYLLASRRSSLPCIGRDKRRGSLDMVAEEQPCEISDGDRGLTSLASLRVPRYRNRSRSLDNSLETTNSFAAFKESLKVRNVKRKVLGT